MKSPADIARQIAPRSSRLCACTDHLSHLINTDMRRIDWMAIGTPEEPQPQRLTDEARLALYDTNRPSTAPAGPLKIRIATVGPDQQKAVRELRERVLKRKQEKLQQLMDRVKVHNKKMQFRDLVELVCQLMEMPLEAAYSKKRCKENVELRCMIIWLARRFTGLSYPLMGKLMGGKDHSTLLHYIKKVESSPHLFELAQVLEINVKGLQKQKEQDDGCQH